MPAAYDVLCYDRSGRERFLEFKTTIGHKRTPFYLTRNARDFAEEAADRFRIFRLYDWGQTPKAFLIHPPLDASLILQPTASGSRGEIGAASSLSTGRVKSSLLQNGRA